MPKSSLISKEELKNLYEKEKLTTYQVAKRLGFSQATIWKKLKEHKVRSRLSGIERTSISKEQLKSLYIDKKMSTWKIEKKLKIPRSTIHRKLKEFGLKVRDRADSHIIYERKDFSGNLLEKAYLIGFRIGDLGVRKIYPNSKTICVASGSTIKEQIDLIKNLFVGYGKVWVKKTKNGKINVQVFLNESFEFLLNKEFPSWTEKNKSLFFSFLAGFTDAEGAIRLNNKMAYYSLGNYDSKTLYLIYKNLNKYKIKCKEPTSDKRKGKLNNQGYPYRSNYWSFRIHDKENLLKLLMAIKPYAKHPNKIKDLNKAVENINQRNTKYGK